MLMIMSHFIREARPRVWTNDERMKLVLEYIHVHICDSINVEEIADLAAVTKPYFIKIFKKKYGMAPSQYKNHLKKLARERFNND